jgi:hypothetical protein
MADARYFIPEHASLKDVYSKDDLRGLLQAGRLSRSDIVFDDQTGLAHLLGDLLMSAYREPRPASGPASEEPAVESSPQELEFRAHTPLPRSEAEQEDEEHDGEGEEVEEAEDEGEDEGDDEEGVEDDVEAEATAGAAVREPMPQSKVARAAGSFEAEELLYHGHPSWLAYPKSVLALFAFGTAAWLFHRLHAELAWVIVSGALGVLPLLMVALDRTTTSYFITTRRVEMESGLIGRSTKEVRIADIRAIDVVQEGFSAIFGIGNVRFDSAAGPDAEVMFVHVRRPHELKHAVRELQG